jgi:hypothetical protein
MLLVLLMLLYVSPPLGGGGLMALMLGRALNGNTHVKEQ